jgi:RNase P subunit RPR2
MWMFKWTCKLCKAILSHAKQLICESVYNEHIYMQCKTWKWNMRSVIEDESIELTKLQSGNVTIGVQ